MDHHHPPSGWICRSRRALGEENHIAAVVWARCGSDGDGLEQQRKREEDRNPDVEPCLRVMERFRRFFCQENRYIITCPKGADSREISIKFHSKGN